MIQNQFKIKTVFIKKIDDSVKNVQLAYILAEHFQNCCGISGEFTKYTKIKYRRKVPYTKKECNKAQSTTSAHRLLQEIHPIFLHIFRIHSHPSPAFISSSMNFISTNSGRG